MKIKIILIIVAILAVLIIGFSLFYYQEETALKNIQNFKECSQNGYPVEESNPRQCKTPDGRNFVEENQIVPVQPLISVDSLKSGDTVTSPLTITGKARGFWYFEASFPVELRGAKGEILASGPAQAQGDWMTEEFVPFSIALNFTSTTTQNGVLVLKKDNPSGLPENEDQISVPLTIEATKK